MIISRFLQWVDSESLRLPQFVIYAFLAVGGLQLLYVNDPTETLSNQMGGLFHLVWAGLLFACPVLVFVGYRMSNQWNGTCLQLGGNLGMLLCLASYIVALGGDGYITRGTLALFGFLGLFFVVAIITLRDIRRLLLIRAVAIEIEKTRDSDGLG